MSDVVLVLASASPARRRLLESAGIAVEVLVSTVDEDSLAADLGPIRPRELCGQLANAKARDVADSVSRDGRFAGRHVLVLGCDSVLELDGVALGKPSDAPDVRRRWAAMSGRSGLLHTGHALIDLPPERDGTAHRSSVATTLVRFGRPSAEELESYIEHGEPLRVAGAFTIDGLGGAFIDGIDGDHGTVIGVSLPLVRRLVTESGLRWTDLWSAES